MVCAGTEHRHHAFVTGRTASALPLSAGRPHNVNRRHTRDMSEVSLDSQVTIHPDAVFRELDGEAVILQLEAGMYFGLDPVGTRLWQLIEEHGRLGPVLDAALGEFDVTADVLERDLVELVSGLVEKQLVIVQ